MEDDAARRYPWLLLVPHLDLRDHLSAGLVPYVFPRNDTECVPCLWIIRDDVNLAAVEVVVVLKAETDLDLAVAAARATRIMAAKK